MKQQRAYSIFTLAFLLLIMLLFSNFKLIAQWNMRVVAYSGGPAPGTENAVFAENSLFYVGFLTNGGIVMFPSSLEPGIGDGTGETGVWIEKDGVLELFYRTGKEIPNSGGSLFATDLGFFCDQRSDRVILFGNFKSNGVDIENGLITTDEDWFLTSHIIEGKRPYSGAVIDFWDVDGFCNGTLLLDCILKEDNDDKVGFNNYFLAKYEPALIAGNYDLVPILRGGEPMEGAPGQIYRNGANSRNSPISFNGGPDPNGQAAIYAIGNDSDYLHDDIKDDNVYTHYKLDQGGNLNILFTMNQGDEKVWLAPSKFNSMGEMVFWGYPGVDDLTQTWSIWVGKDVDRVVATKGEQLLGAAPGELLDEMGMWNLLDDGRVIFFAGLSNDKKGIWMEDKDHFLRNIALTGKPPQNSKIVTGFDVLYPYAINTEGTVAFRVWGRDNSGQDMQEIWAGDTDGLELVCRTGDKVELNTDDIRIIRSLVMPHHSGFEDYSVKPWYSSAMNTNNELLISVRFTDGTEALVVASSGFIVNSIDDDVDKNPGDGICECEGPEIGGKPKCTLRAALMEANATKGKNSITFDIPVKEDLHFIQPETPLPDINDPVSITGSLNDQQKPDIYIKGKGAVTNFNGLNINFDGEGSHIRNLIIMHFDHGININESWNNSISSCYIGTDADEGDVAGNRIGIIIKDGNGNTIGGNSKDQGNYVSGNGENGLVITGEGSKNNKILFNVIGPRVDMENNPGNGKNGILIINGATENLVSDNVISGNIGHGLHIIGTSENKTGKNSIHKNFIGTDFNNDLKIPNEQNGILIENSGSNIIGGAPDGGDFSGNRISNNKGNGIEIKGKLSSVNSIKGNSIGMFTDDNVISGNEGDGIFINSAPKNIIGILQLKPGEGLGNAIGNNIGSGIRIKGEDANGNTVEGNQIQDNEYGVKIVDAPENTIGFESSGPNNIISLNKKDGVLISGELSIRNTLHYNYIGTDDVGLIALQNEENGIHLTGGTTENSINHNLISGNMENGIFINGEGNYTKSNFVNDNKIGLKSDGFSPLPNLHNGIYILNSPDNIISSLNNENFPGNIISGNKECGILIIGQKSSSNKIFNSFIGTSEDGAQRLQNGQDGIHITNDASEVEIGKPIEPGTKGGNLISGNAQNGIYIGGSSFLNIINGNLIGTNRLGTVAIENSMDGIWIDDSPQNIIGNGSGYNLISGNGNNGITVFGKESSDNFIDGNRIGTDLTGKSAIGNRFGIKFFRTKKNTIESNLISGNFFGIVISECTDENFIKDNIIGLDIDSENKVSNNSGIGIDLSKNTVIGTSNLNEGNTISGNINIGISILNSDSNHISGNIIGTSKDGKKNLGNGFGVLIDKSKENIIGGSNTISGNSSFGILMQYAESNKIFQNNIGTDVFANSPIPNGTGVSLYGCKNIQIGGTESDRNIITGNGVGIEIQKSWNISISGNLIGPYKIHSYLPGNSIGIKITRGSFYIGKSQYFSERSQSPNLIGNNDVGISIGSRIQGDNPIVTKGWIVSNEIFDNSIGIKTDYFHEKVDSIDNIFTYSKNIRIQGNFIHENERGVEISSNKGKSYILENNKFENNTSNTSGIHMDSSAFAIIRGNQITGDAGSAIFLNNSSDALIEHNNLFNNTGHGVYNLDPLVSVNAMNNWWGDASGPGGEGTGSGDEVSSYVNYSDWLTESISMFVSTGADTVFVTAGLEDSTIVVFRNWKVPEDKIDVTCTDDLGWLEGEDSMSIKLDDSLGVATLLKYKVPVGATEGTSDEVSVEAVSQTDQNDKAVDTFILHVYLPSLATIGISPDTVLLSQGEKFRFIPTGYDQHGAEMNFSPLWEATGGEIDSNGVYKAGFNPGTFEVFAKDINTRLQAKAIVFIDTNVTSIKDNDIMKFPNHDIRIVKVFPNPSSGIVRFQIKTDKISYVLLIIYDNLGQKVETIFNGILNKGINNVTWGPFVIPNGIYYYKVILDSKSESGNVIIMK